MELEKFMDFTALILLAVCAIGIMSQNAAVSIAMIVLLLLRITHLDSVFPILEKYGLSVGIIILTIGVMAPLASGSMSLATLGSAFLNWRSLIAIAVGIFVAYLGGRGATLIELNPTIVAGLLIGTVIGVAFFRGVPVGPLIAAGMVALMLGSKASP
jgi:uncharacterized membrane protein (DUF441 family)